MGVKERKEREKEAFRSLVLQKASEMIREGGLKSFSMRKLADSLEYSASRLYLYFENKEQILKSLSEQIGQNLIAALKEVPHFRDKEKYLVALARANIEFYGKQPVVLEIALYPMKEKPASYLEVGKLYENALRGLDLNVLQTQKQIDEALDLIHMLLSGMAQGITQMSHSGEKIGKLLESSLGVIMRGWKAMESGQ